MTEPEPRNSSALKNACVIMWKIAATYAPEPMARNMKPSWLTVEYANTFLMSFCATAMVAAKSAVPTPTHAMSVNTHGDASARMGLARVMRYTPEVTMVAAWMSADTGVGPAMASGSQRYSGNCADLPHAPTNSNRAIAVAVLVAIPLLWMPSKRSVYLIVPNAPKDKNIATMKPQSPMRLVTKAFLPAVAFESLVCQNEMRK